MISTNTKKCDEILSIVNDEIKKRNLEGIVPLFPMLRVQDGKLYYGVLIVGQDDNVWNSTPMTKASYWTLLDINSLEIVDFNKVEEKDYTSEEMNITDEKLNKQKELSKYEINKNIQYMEYLMNDIKNDNIPIQKELIDILDNKINIDGEAVNANDYLMANIEEDIKEKVKELVNLILQQKYSSISFYYECLIEKIVDIYKTTQSIDKEKINIAIKIMNNYYDGVIGIRQFFNI